MSTKIKISDLQKRTEAYTRSVNPESESNLEQYVKEDKDTSLNLGYVGKIARIDHVSEVNSDGVSTFFMGYNKDREEADICLQLVGQAMIVGKMKVVYNGIEYVIIGLDLEGTNNMKYFGQTITKDVAFAIDKIFMGPIELFEIDI